MKRTRAEIGKGSPEVSFEKDNQCDQSPRVQAKIYFIPLRLRMKVPLS